MANGTGAVYVDFGMVKIDGYRLPMQVACGVSGGNAQIISAKGSLPFALKYPTGYEQKRPLFSRGVGSGTTKLLNLKGTFESSSLLFGQP